MYYSPFSNYWNPYSYGNYTPYHQPQRKQPYYQPTPYHSSYYDYDPTFNYYPTHYPNYDPYEEELRRRQEKKTFDEKEKVDKLNSSLNKRKQNKTVKNKKINLQDPNKMENEDKQYESSSFEQINSQHDSSFEQITNESLQNNTQAKPDQTSKNNNNNLQNNLPKFIRVDSKTYIQEEQINYWKEVNSNPDKNNLQDCLIEERYPEEIEQKAEKLSKIVQKDYSYCLQVILQNPDYTMGMYIDIILNKQQKRQQL
ncbi:hypothetical protein TTHERM_00691760 (macronuclear) [Tetrahymena thermophila SB210]|uniref:Uncharacterized protein n=1 Tax=Tetrahymena thermophila (strain SB210) TaxID=312017 RepID=I7M672_TETTS|nr:hypothetical protein TTHERM_00691760 [Tetrahymena thermophila SB210]EAR84478.1 hypothetical protein TTHERM_00691760 [Tetrahymena thermophila SB210]|eukprot:XP_001032141.1 hypothetical protein TTHERM_00691760 [Tetrahymena thermophila SB210]